MPISVRDEDPCLGIGNSANRWSMIIMIIIILTLAVIIGLIVYEFINVPNNTEGYETQTKWRRAILIPTAAVVLIGAIGGISNKFKVSKLAQCNPAYSDNRMR